MTYDTNARTVPTLYVQKRSNEIQLLLKAYTHWFRTYHFWLTNYRYTTPNFLRVNIQVFTDGSLLQATL